MIGYGSATQILAVFQPEPHATYAIQPTNTVYLTKSDLAIGVMVDIAQTGKPLRVDFVQRGNRVRVKHLPNGEFAIEG